MEAKGAINIYTALGKSKIVTINLANGVTAFIHIVDGVEYMSSCYKIKIAGGLIVTNGNYRPRKEEFDVLSEGLKIHVLNGGLLIAPLDQAVRCQLSEDPIEKECGFHRFQAWCMSVYGRAFHADDH